MVAAAAILLGLGVAGRWRRLLRLLGAAGRWIGKAWLIFYLPPSFLFAFFHFFPTAGLYFSATVAKRLTRLNSI
jgi:hypothetical protein